MTTCPVGWLGAWGKVSIEQHLLQVRAHDYSQVIHKSSDLIS